MSLGEVTILWFPFCAQASAVSSSEVEISPAVAQRNILCILVAIRFFKPRTASSGYIDDTRWKMTELRGSAWWMMFEAIFRPLLDQAGTLRRQRCLGDLSAFAKGRPAGIQSRALWRVELHFSGWMFGSMRKRLET
jgi:hypothetical protein